MEYGTFTFTHFFKVITAQVCKDRGINGRVTYSLEPASITRWLAVDRVTGTITAKVSFDREETSAMVFDVVAVDGGRTPRSARTRVNVTIEDEDDEVATWFSVDYFQSSI